MFAKGPAPKTPLRNAAATSNFWGEVICPSPPVSASPYCIHPLVTPVCFSDLKVGKAPVLQCRDLQSLIVDIWIWVSKFWGNCTKQIVNIWIWFVSSGHGFVEKITHSQLLQKVLISCFIGFHFLWCVLLQPDALFVYSWSYCRSYWKW